MTERVWTVAEVNQAIEDEMPKMRAYIEEFVNAPSPLSSLLNARQPVVRRADEDETNAPPAPSPEN